MKKLIALLLLNSCVGADPVVTGGSSGSSAAAATANTTAIYPNDSAYTEGDTSHQYWLFSGANAQGQMGDFNSLWRTILVSFDITGQANVTSARFYIFRHNSNDLPNVGFDPFGAMAYLHTEKLQAQALVPGMGRSDIWFYGADYTVPSPIGNLANDNSAYAANNSALSVDITSALNESINNHDTLFVMRLRHTGNTASGIHRVDFHLKHSQSHSYKPYMEMTR